MMTFLCSRFGDCEGAGFVADFLSTDMDLRMDEAGARWPAKVRQCSTISRHFKEINQLVKTVSLNRKKICTRPDSNSRDGAQRRRSRNHSAIGTSTALHPPVVV